MLSTDREDMIRGQKKRDVRYTRYMLNASPRTDQRSLLKILIGLAILIFVIGLLNVSGQLLHSMSGDEAFVAPILTAVLCLTRARLRMKTSSMRLLI